MKLIRKIQGEKKGLKIAILGCVHGNEDYSLQIFKKLKNIKLLLGEIDCYLVNEEAFKLNKRFVDIDLNRSFNLKEGLYEVGLASKIKDKLSKYDYIIDMHSTTSKSPPFLIYVNEILNNNKFINAFNIQKRVLISNAQYSLIYQFENAISIEISIALGKNLAINKGFKYILNFLSSFNLINKNITPLRYFENYICVGKMKINNQLKDFNLTYVDNEYVYPILSGEVEYANSNCFKVKKFYL